MDEKHVCGRRGDAYWYASSPAVVEAILAKTTPGDTFEIRHTTGMNAGKRSCSYCGSLHPDDLLAMVAANEVELGPTDKNYKVYVHGADHWNGKFYFQHLDDAQRTRFVELHNAGAMRIGYPGRFYVLPFFMGRA